MFINFLVWIIVGGLIGWLASMIMRRDAQQGILLNIVVGIVGAFLAGLILTPFLGVGTINESNFSIAALVVSLGGAVILLAVVNLFNRGTGSLTISAVCRLDEKLRAPEYLMTPVWMKGRRTPVMLAVVGMGSSEFPVS